MPARRTHRMACPTLLPRLARRAVRVQAHPARDESDPAEKVVDVGLPRYAYAPSELQVTSHLPRSILCPITTMPMRDPVVTADGFSYEREAIRRWFSYRVTSPVTGAVLATTRVLPNYALRATIHELLHPVREEEEESLEVDASGSPFEEKSENASSQTPAVPDGVT